MMYDELIKRMRELASIPEHCEDVESCDQCPKEDICLSFTNKQIIEVVTQAADAIEELLTRIDGCENCKIAEEWWSFVHSSVTQKWIPVTERLPEIGKKVLVYLFKNSPYIAWHDGKCWYIEEFCLDDDECPTYWMPLPEPPKEDE